MDSRLLSTPVVGLAVTTVVVALATWRWQASIFRAQPTTVIEDAWERVKDAYPLPQDVAKRVPISGETAEAVVRANPFSPQRRFVPPAPRADTGSGIAVTPEQARFVYKGQISVGTHQRAILENTTTQKTHFLEVGQEVAGFKVLDITQNQVILSDLQTHEDIVVPLVSSDKRAREAPAAPSEP